MDRLSLRGLLVVLGLLFSVFLALPGCSGEPALRLDRAATGSLTGDLPINSLGEAIVSYRPGVRPGIYHLELTAASPVSLAVFDKTSGTCLFKRHAGEASSGSAVPGAPSGDARCGLAADVFLDRGYRVQVLGLLDQGETIIYTLTLTKPAADQTDPNEPNDTLAEAVLLTGAEIKGTVHAGDRDWFLLDVTEPGYYCLEASWPPLPEWGAASSPGPAFTLSADGAVTPTLPVLSAGQAYRIYDLAAGRYYLVVAPPPDSAAVFAYAFRLARDSRSRFDLEAAKATAIGVLPYVGHFPPVPPAAGSVLCCFDLDVEADVVAEIDYEAADGSLELEFLSPGGETEGKSQPARAGVFTLAIARARLGPGRHFLRVTGELAGTALTRDPGPSFGVYFAPGPNQTTVGQVFLVPTKPVAGHLFQVGFELPGLTSLHDTSWEVATAEGTAAFDAPGGAAELVLPEGRHVLTYRDRTLALSLEKTVEVVRPPPHAVEDVWAALGLDQAPTLGLGTFKSADICFDETARAEVREALRAVRLAAPVERYLDPAAPEDPAPYLAAYILYTDLPGLTIQYCDGILLVECRDDKGNRTDVGWYMLSRDLHDIAREQRAREARAGGALELAWRGRRYVLWDGSAPALRYPQVLPDSGTGPLFYDAARGDPADLDDPPEFIYAGPGEWLVPYHLAGGGD